MSYKRGTSNFVPQPGGMTLGTVPALTSSLTTFPQWFAGLTASQLVYDFGETINRWKAARVAADAADESTHTTEAQVAYNARSAFFTARAAKDLVGVARDTLANQEKHLAQVTGFVEVGTHPEIDLSQAKADRATAQLQLINAENNYAVAKAMLNMAMGVERSVDYDLSDEELPPVEGEDAQVEALIDVAKQSRPEMANLRLNLQSQELGLRSARDMYWPNLGLAGTANDSGPYLDRTNWNFSGVVTLSVPLLQGGAIDAQIHQAQGQVVQAQAQLETERQQVRLDVEQARLGIRVRQGRDRRRGRRAGQHARSAAPRRGALRDGRRQHHRARRRAGGAHHRRRAEGLRAVPALHRARPAPEGAGPERLSSLASVTQRHRDPEEAAAGGERAEVERAGLALVGGAQRRGEDRDPGPATQPYPPSASSQTPTRAVPTAPRQNAPPPLASREKASKSVVSPELEGDDASSIVAVPCTRPGARRAKR